MDTGLPQPSRSESDELRTPRRLIPQRYVVTLMILLVVINSYANRDTLMYTIQYFAEISQKKHLYKNVTIGQHCEILQDNYHKTSSLVQNTTTKLVKLEQSSVGTINAILFVSYLPTHILGGIYSDSRSPKRVISISTLVTSVINICTPVLISATKSNLTVLKVLRLLMGISQGAFLPASTTLMAHWAPVRERASISTISVSGLYIGLICSKICTSILVESSGSWSTPYYVFGAMGIVIALLWELWVFPNPEKDPRITPEEKDYLAVELREIVDHRRKDIPYRAILTSFHVWVLIVAFIAYRWIGNFFAFTLPEYLEVVLKYNERESLLISSLPFLPITVILILSGFLSDWIVRNGYINLITVRKVFSTIGMMGPPIYMLTGSFASCNRFAAVVLFVLALSLMVFTFLGLYLITLDLGPNYAGFTTSLTNGLGNISWVFLNKVKDIIAPDKTVLQYRKLFWLSMVIAVVTNTIFMIFGTTKVQAWNKPLVKGK
ncbi:sialin [Tribolium castaneum]|uniref:sialin n=1 Tax=Tribolium castaneum TaxID=7070 RepID=UPI0030FF136C